MQWSCSHSTSCVSPCITKKVTLSQSPALWPPHSHIAIYIRMYVAICIWVSLYLWLGIVTVLWLLVSENPNGARKLYRSWPFAGGSLGLGSTATFCVLPLSRSIIMISVIIIMPMPMPMPIPMPMPNRGVQFRSELKSYHFDSLFFRGCWFGWFRRTAAFFRVRIRIRFRFEVEFRPWLIYFYFHFINLGSAFNWTLFSLASPIRLLTLGVWPPSSFPFDVAIVCSLCRRLFKLGIDRGLCLGPNMFGLMSFISSGSGWIGVFGQRV